jgi:hypothetical protein
MSFLHAGIGGHVGIKVIEGIVGREIDREKTNDLQRPMTYNLLNDLERTTS